MMYIDIVICSLDVCPITSYFNSGDPGHLLKVTSEHRDGGEPGHDRLHQLVHPGGHPGELARLRPDHLDQLGDLATTDGAELQESLHTPPDILL